MQQHTVADILPLAARLQGRKISTLAGSQVFAVARGWPAEILRSEPEVTTVRTPSELEAAVQNSDTDTIFVPCDTFGWSLLEKILQRNSLTKTIFWEE